MDTQAIAAAIQAEIIRLQQALSILTGRTPIKRLGRPPKTASLEGRDGPFPMVKRTRTFSKAQRLAASKRMKARWAAKKKAAKKSA